MGEDGGLLNSYVFRNPILDDKFTVGFRQNGSTPTYEEDLPTLSRTI